MGSSMVRRSCWVGGGTFISDIRHVPVVVISSVRHNLDTAVWQGNPEQQTHL